MAWPKAHAWAHGLSTDSWLRRTLQASPRPPGARRARLAVRQGHVGLVCFSLHLQRTQAPAHSARPEPFQPEALCALQRLRMAQFARRAPVQARSKQARVSRDSSAQRRG